MATSSLGRNVLVGAVSVVVPVVVAVLFFMPKIETDASWLSILPHLNSVVNGTTAVVLLVGLYFIKKRDIEKHKAAMLTAFALGFLFLVFYVTYHATMDSTVYGDIDRDGILSEVEKAALGSMRGVYLFVLASHILMAIAGLPFILMAYYHALSGTFDKHKKVVKFALPIWLYVSVTGVIVYLMISPYY